jgi:PAS domain S-box-containing protein
MSAVPTLAAPLLTLEHDFLADGGEMGALMRSLDWSRTALGPVESWPQSLKTAIRIMLTSRYAMWMAWGENLVFFCNDAYRPTLGVKHPWALGRPAQEVWAEIWKDIGPRIASVLRTGKATWDEGLLLFLKRSGYLEETYHTFSYSPLPGDAGGVAGMLCVVTEETERVIGGRRLASLRDLAAGLAGTRTVEEVMLAVHDGLEANPKDLPFSLAYLFDGDAGAARLACATGLPPGHPAAPKVLDPADPDAAWPSRRLLACGVPLMVTDLPARFGALPLGGWDKPPQEALLVPIARQGQERPAGFLVAGINPYRPMDAAHEGFIGLVVGQIAAAVAGARAYEEERRRAEALAELDQAKTTFFANVSHEFRTPLTLLLGPLEEVLDGADGPLPPAARERVGVAHRNALRLLRLVNALLDFSRVEAGRAQASFAPLDLAALTTDLASTFRSLCERAGLALDVDCPPLAEPVFVDRDMWEKIVLNLLSNAFKFTHEGGIRVSLRAMADGHAAELVVQDSGIGIPAAELPRLFERFHRVEGARGRSHEGTGIGLALVQELVRLHGGDISAESELGRGTAFAVRVPLGQPNLPTDQAGTAPSPPRVQAYVEEALCWLPEGEAPKDEVGAEPVPADASRPRVLLADDNADMRDYVRRLLAGRYSVQAVGDGEAALQAALANPPDLVLSDVMMPGLDGLALTAALRADPRTALVPIVLLSARAGEEAQVEGLGTGADDYLTKPFSAREMLARVRGNLELGRARRQAAGRERQLRAEAEAMRTRFETLIEHLPVGAGLFDAQGRVLAANEICHRFVPGSTLPSKDPQLADRWIGFHPDGRRIEAADRAGSRALRGEVVHAQQLRFRDDEGVERWTEVSAIPVRDADGAVTGAVVVILDTDEARRAEAALRESEERFRVAADSAPVLIWTTDAEAQITFANRWYEEVFGRPASDMAGSGWRRVIHPEDLDAFFAAFLDAFQQRVPFKREVRAFSREGGLRWLRFDGLPRFDGAGAFLGYTGCGVDITDSKQAEARQRLLIAELNHRVKNTLATVQSLAQQSLRSADAPPGFAATFGSRLLALARAHDLLTREEWEGATLADVAATALAPWLGDGRITLAGPTIRLVPKQALALSMALGELATNAVKHGALSVPGGRVSLAWGRGSGDGTALEWAEAGGPAVRAPVRRGLGSRLLGRPLAAELGGAVDLRFDPAGVRCVVSFPASGRAAP